MREEIDSRQSTVDSKSGARAEPAQCPEINLEGYEVALHKCSFSVWEM
jgi:hypothetical protein